MKDMRERKVNVVLGLVSHLELSFRVTVAQKK